VLIPRARLDQPHPFDVRTKEPLAHNEPDES
jgi:hypothetical protein